MFSFRHIDNLCYYFILFVIIFETYFRDRTISWDVLSSVVPSSLCSWLFSLTGNRRKLRCTVDEDGDGDGRNNVCLYCDNGFDGG